MLNIGNTSSASLQATGAFLPFEDVSPDKIGGKSRLLGPSLAAIEANGQPLSAYRSAARLTASATTRSCPLKPVSPPHRRPGKNWSRTAGS
ncbi:hypothetical protein QMK34_04280 [Amycolatopsis sp. H20-H5]|nr:hypothetical protein [Amycolatopsis sp. H20-H5]